MSDEIKPPMPEQPKTMQLPAADKNEILLAELKALVVSGFNSVNAKVDRVETNLGIVSDDVRVTKDRLANAENRLSTLETRAQTTSEFARAASKTDLEQAAQLAQERAAREALATKLDELSTSQATQLAILGRLDRIAKNPIVKTLAAMLATAAITWLAAHGVHVQ